MAPSAPVLVLLSLIAAPASGTAASARAPVAFHVELDAPAGCTTTEAVVRNVEARVGRARRAQPNEAGPTFKLRITRTGPRVHGALSVVDGRGETEARTVDGASCDEIVEALSLTMALSLSPSPEPKAPEPKAPPAPRARPTSAPAARTPATPPPATRAPAVSAPPPPATPPPAAPTPTATPPAVRPAAPPPSEPPPPPPPTPASPPPPPATPPPEAPPPPPPPSAPPTVEAPGGTAQPAGPTRVSLGISAIVAQPVSPPISLGGALSLAIAWPKADPETVGAAPTLIGLTVVHVANDYLQTANELVARWTALAASVCPPVGLGGRIELQACGRATAGWLTATDHAIANPTPKWRTWFGVGALLRLSVPVGGGFALEAAGGVDFPLVKRRFMVTSPDTDVGETPVAAGWAGLGLAHSL